MNVLSLQFNFSFYTRLPFKLVVRHKFKFLCFYFIFNLDQLCLKDEKYVQIFNGHLMLLHDISNLND